MAYGSGEVARALTRRCYPETVGFSLSSSLSLSVGFSILKEATDVARYAPQGVHIHADGGCRLKVVCVALANGAQVTAEGFAAMKTH